MLYCLLLPPAFARLGGAAIFKSQGVMSAFYAVYVWLRLPETKGYEISEIESILHHTEWVPFEPAPPAATDADALRESALRAARGGSAALELHRRGGGGDAGGVGGSPKGAAAASPSSVGVVVATAAADAQQREFSDWDEWDVWGGRGAYRT
jgi:hypothetical protein